MGNQVLELASCVVSDLTLDDVNRIVQEQPFKAYSFNAWDSMSAETDATWHLLGGGPLMEMVPFGRMRLNLMRDRDNQATGGALDDVAALIKSKSVETAKRLADARTPFDMVIDYPVLETKETYIDVPKTVKKGLFRRETIYEKQKRVAYSYSEDSIRFNGWRFAHFERLYQAYTPSYQTSLNWDFVLGSDGKIYHITHSWTRYAQPVGPNSADSSYIVRAALFYDPCILRNKNQAYFIGVSHGALLTLNSILPESSERYTIKTSPNEEETFNFPTQPPLDAKVNPYPQNLLTRLDSLGTN